MGNQYGICEWCLPERGPEAVRHAAQLGFDGIQLAEQGGWEAGFPLLRPEVQDEYRRLRDETGIVYQSLHLWSLCRLACMIHPLDSTAGKIAVESIRAAARACADLEIPVIMVTSGFMSQIKNRLDFVVFREHLREACRIAADHGVRIVFESALSVDEILEMSSFCGPALKVCYDVFNPIRFHMAAPQDEIPRLGTELIDHFHLKDGPETMIGCSLLGDGVGNFPAVVRAVENISYTGWFVTENYYADFPLNGKGNFDDLAREDLRRMRQAFGAG